MRMDEPMTEREIRQRRRRRDEIRQAVRRGEETSRLIGHVLRIAERRAAERRRFFRRAGLLK